MTFRERALWIAQQFYGHWYTWGGDDPSGFDCSGLIVEIGKSIGLLPRKQDWTAHMLYERWRPYLVDRPKPGAVAFWAGDGRVSHVEMCLGDGLAIGASGGGPWVRTREDAIRHNAFIKIRPLASRAGLVGVCDPIEGMERTIS